MNMMLEDTGTHLSMVFPKNEPIWNDGTGVSKYRWLIVGLYHWMMGNAVWVTDKDKNFIGFVSLEKLVDLASKVRSALMYGFHGLSRLLQQDYASEGSMVHVGQSDDEPDKIRAEINNLCSVGTVSISEISAVFNHVVLKAKFS